MANRDKYRVLISFKLQRMEVDGPDDLAMQWLEMTGLDDLPGEQVDVVRALTCARQWLGSHQAEVLQSIASMLIQVQYEQPVLPFG